MKIHNLLQRIHSVISSKKAALELTGKAEKEYKRIMSELKQMTPEERMDFFQNMKPESIRFLKKIDGTTYVVRAFFNPKAMKPCWIALKIMLSEIFEFAL